jgi:hypothetical protein
LSLQRCEGKDLESVLEQVRNRFGDTATIVEANRLRTGGVAGFFSRERFEVVVDVEGDDEDGSPAPADLPAEFGLEATEDFCDRLLSLADGVSDLEQHAPAPAPISTEQPEFSAVLASITRHMGAPTHMEAPTPATAPAPAPVPASGPVPAPLDAPVPRAKPTVDARALARLGLPEEIRRAAAAAPAAAGADPSAWLLGLLGDLPAAPRLPQGPGSVIVVVGARDAALHLSRQLAAELGLDPDSLLIASPNYKGRAVPAERRVASVDAAAEARSSWRRRPRPTVVAVDAPIGRPAEWARRVIDALEPTMVWGAADATRKPEDLFEWSEQLGGFDAFGISGTEITVSPAAVLQCGIPVGRLEGRPATPLLWAALLAPRLTA